MKIAYSFNLIRIDFENLHSVEDCKKMLFEHNIDEHDIVPQKLFDAKSKYDILFYDSKTFFLVACVKKGKKEIIFLDEYQQHMLAIEPINQLWKEISELSLDYILDKINKIGIKYLTDNERLYLAKQSGK